MWSRHSLLKYLLENLEKISYYIDSCTTLFIEAQFRRSQFFKQLVCPSTVEWIKESYYSYLKKNFCGMQVVKSHLKEMAASRDHTIQWEDETVILKFTYWLLFPFEFIGASISFLWCFMSLHKTWMCETPGEDWKSKDLFKDCILMKRYVGRKTSYLWCP